MDLTLRILSNSERKIIKPLLSWRPLRLRNNLKRKLQNCQSFLKQMKKKSKMSKSLLLLSLRKRVYLDLLIQALEEYFQSQLQMQVYFQMWLSQSLQLLKLLKKLHSLLRLKSTLSLQILIWMLIQTLFSTKQLLSNRL